MLLDKIPDAKHGKHQEGEGADYDGAALGITGTGIIQLGKKNSYKISGDILPQFF